ncbi:MAG: hypothetical protein QM742_16120 [Aquabacterium sp.]
MSHTPLARPIWPALTLTTALVLSACGKPLPADKAAYAGTWTSPQMSLLITPDGSVKYARLEAGATKSISGPLQGFDGHNFSVGVGPMAATFVVSAPPHLTAGVTTMTVDGVVLTREAP